MFESTEKYWECEIELEVAVDFVQFFHTMLKVVLLQLYSKSLFLHPWKTFLCRSTSGSA